MFRPFVEREVRHELRGEHKDIDLLDHARLSGAIANARDELKAKHGVEMPACAFPTENEPVGAIGDGHILAWIKEKIAEFKAWLATPQGQMFLKILGAIVSAIIAMLLAGS